MNFINSNLSFNVWKIFIIKDNLEYEIMEMPLDGQNYRIPLNLGIQETTSDFQFKPKYNPTTLFYDILSCLHWHKWSIVPACLCHSRRWEQRQLKLVHSLHSGDGDAKTPFVPDIRSARRNYYGYKGRIWDGVQDGHIIDSVCGILLVTLLLCCTIIIENVTCEVA